MKIILTTLLPYFFLSFSYGQDNERWTKKPTPKEQASCSYVEYFSNIQIDTTLISIGGYVIDCKTKKGIKGVRLYDCNDPKKTICSSGKNGEFHFMGGFKFWLCASKKGYKTMKAEIEQFGTGCIVEMKIVILRK